MKCCPVSIRTGIVTKVYITRVAWVCRIVIISAVITGPITGVTCFITSISMMYPWSKWIPCRAIMGYLNIKMYVIPRVIGTTCFL